MSKFIREEIVDPTFPSPASTNPELLTSSSETSGNKIRKNLSPLVSSICRYLLENIGGIKGIN